MRSLLASLNDHPLAMLRGIAELHGLALTTNVRDDAAAQLAAQLAEPKAVELALAACSSQARAAWSALQAAGGRMKMSAFARAYGIIRPIGPGKLERERAWLSPETPAEELWYRGLIFKAFADLGEGVLEYIYIPDEMLTPAGRSLSTQAGPKLAPLAPAAVPSRQQQAYNSLAVDLCAVLAAMREMPFRLDRAGQPVAADMARLQEGLLLPDPVRRDLLLSLARSQGWLAPDRDRLVVNVQAATAWLRKTIWEQMTALFVGWRDATAWNDLLHVPSLQAEGTWRNDPLLARRAILGFLLRADPHAWYGIADLIAAIKSAEPDFQRPDGNYTGWYLRDVATGRYLSGFDAWDEVEGRLIRFIVTGPLFWLGAVSLGLAADDQPVAFRQTPFGAAWLSGRIPAERPRPARLAIDDKFTVSAPLTLPLLDRFRLLRFTEPAGGPYVLGQPTRHRITRGSLARARAAGLRADAIVQFLGRASGGHVPPRLVAALNRWQQHSGTVRISRGALIRVADASTLANLRADPTIAPLLGDLISAQAVLVSEANLAKVIAALAELGYQIQEDER